MLLIVKFFTRIKQLLDIWILKKNLYHTMPLHETWKSTQNLFKICVKSAYLDNLCKIHLAINILDLAQFKTGYLQGLQSFKPRISRPCYISLWVKPNPDHI